MRHSLFAFAFALLASLSLALPARAQGTTWLVSEGLEFGHFTDVQAAVDAAADGDLILVRAGHYGPFAIDDKALTIAAETPETVWIEASLGSSIKVENLAAHRAVHLVDLNVYKTGADDVGNVFLHDNVGHVSLDGLVVGTTQQHPIQQSLRVVSCDDVQIVDSGFAQGVLVRLSTVRIYESHIRGAEGVGCFNPPAKPGGPGLEVVSGDVLLADTVVRGGRGGAGSNPLNCCNAEGGPALRLGTDGPTVTVRGGTLQTGAPGMDMGCAGFPPPIDVLSGTVIQDTGATPSGGFQTTWAQSGSTSGIAVTAELGQGALVGFSTGAATTPTPVAKGDLLLTLPLLVTVPMGPGTGFATGLESLVPYLPPGTPPLEVFAQTLANDPVDGPILGPRDRVLVLDLESSLAGTADCDGDGVKDAYALWSGAARDDDGSGVPDACETFPTVFLDPGAAGDPLADGSAAHPFATFQAAVDSIAGDTFTVLELAPGLYTGPGNVDVALTGRRLLVRGSDTTTTVADLGQQGRLFHVDTESRVTLEGFTIMNGLRADTGGALRVFNATLRLRDMHLEANTGLAGGALYGYGSTIDVQDSHFVLNHATEDGGAFYENGSGSAPGGPIGSRFTRCTFADNSAGSDGGAFSSHGKTVGPRVVASSFVGNTADLNGGAMYLTSSTAVFESCHFGGNAAAYNGGAFYTQRTTTPFYLKPFTLRQCTLRDNYAFIQGAAIHGYGAVIEGSLFWGHTIEPSILSVEISVFGNNNTSTFFQGAFETPEYVFRDTTLEYGVAGMVYTGSPEILEGPGMSSVDPQFASADSANPALAPGSPAIDTGGATWVPPLGATDIQGEPRLQGGRLDRGADEN